ncbi:MAG: helix-turn-helix domain-containing protein [Myxococcota bacterium]
MESMQPPTGSRAAAKAETRAALIDAALAEFSERGFDAPSLDAICARAGFTRGAFYVHFKTREDLIVAVVETVLGALLDAVIGTDAGDGNLAQTIDLYVNLSAQGRERLDETGAGTQDWVAQVPLHQLVAASERAPALQDRLRQILVDALDRLGDVVDREGQRGAVREDVAARDLSGLLVLLALGLRVAADLRLPVEVEPLRAAVKRLLAR